MIAPKSYINQLIAKGAYIVTPGWLKSWKKFAQEKWKFEKETAHSFFKDSLKEILILDTGVYELKSQYRLQQDHPLY